MSRNRRPLPLRTASCEALEVIKTPESKPNAEQSQVRESLDNVTCDVSIADRLWTLDV